MTPTIAQADREAAARLAALAELRPMLLSGRHDDHPYIRIVAAHREAGELAGVRIGMAFAVKNIVSDGMALAALYGTDPAVVIARHGGVFPSARKNLP